MTRMEHALAVVTDGSDEVTEQHAQYRGSVGDSTAQDVINDIVNFALDAEVPDFYHKNRSQDVWYEMLDKEDLNVRVGKVADAWVEVIRWPHSSRSWLTAVLPGRCECPARCSAGSTRDYSDGSLAGSKFWLLSVQSGACSGIMVLLGRWAGCGRLPASNGIHCARGAWPSQWIPFPTESWTRCLHGRQCSHLDTPNRWRFGNMHLARLVILGLLDGFIVKCGHHERTAMCDGPRRSNLSHYAYIQTLPYAVSALSSFVNLQAFFLILRRWAFL